MKFFVPVVAVISFWLAPQNLSTTHADIGKNPLQTGAEQTHRYVPY